MLAMMVDFGSTFTKIVVVDVDQEEVVARAISPSTVDIDITIGLKKALQEVGSFQSQTDLRLACSSAAGGLRIVAIGLVPELTSEAARQAALGAGARVIGVYSHKLTTDDLKRIEESKPDIILLSGGTDGGDCDTAKHNGDLISKSRLSSPIVVACNREVASEIHKKLTSSEKTSVVTENVMPELGKLNVEPAKDAIRKVFIKHITRAKGMEKLRGILDVVMPTPSAGLRATQLVADGTPNEPGLGDTLVVEVGGATTNVYSVFEEPVRERNVISKGIREGRVKRTVEGDLGIRISAVSLVETAGVENVRALTRKNTDLDVPATAASLAKNPATLARTQEEIEFDDALTRLAVRYAVERHVGTIEEFTTPSGTYYFQIGKNYAKLRTLIGSGGPIVHNQDPSAVLAEAVKEDRRPDILKPVQPELFIDSEYILWSMGLLSLHYPDAALRMLRNSIRPAQNRS